MLALTRGMPEFSLRHWQAWSIWLALLLFPMFAAGAQGGASYPFAVLVLIGLIYGWRCWPELAVWERRLFGGFALFFAAIFVSFLLGEDMREGARRLEKYATFLFFIPAYLAVRRFVREPGRPFVAGLLLAPLCALGFGLNWNFNRLLAILTLRKRLDGFYDTIILSNVTGLMTLLLLAAILIFSVRWRSLLSGGVLVLVGLLVVVAAGSRNGLLFIPVGMVAVFALLHRYVDRRHGVIVVVLLAVIMGMVTISPNNVVVKRVNKALSYLNETGSSSEFSVSTRIEMWRDSLTMWQDAPVFGVGLGEFEAQTERLVAEGRSDASRVFGHAHSIYFDALATTGIVGFVAMLWFAFGRPAGVGYAAWRASNSRWAAFYATTVVLTVVGFMFFGLTEAWFSRSPMVRTYLMCLLIALAGLAKFSRTEPVAPVASP